MISIKKVRTLDGQVTDFTVPSASNHLIEAEGRLLLFPGVVDPHISFGSLQKSVKKWSTEISTAIQAGITSAIELPCKELPASQKEEMQNKRLLIDEQLVALQAPLNLFLYARADRETIEGLGNAKELVKGIVLQLDASKNESLDNTWKRVFQMAAWQNVPLVLNANQECRRDKTYLEKAFEYAEEQNAAIYLLNLSNQIELSLLREGRKRGLLIYAETTPEHLFQNDQTATKALWEAINSGEIETIGSGYDADCPLREEIFHQNQSYPFQHPQFLLPLLLTASEQGLISKEKLVHQLRLNVQDIFNLSPSKDFVLVEFDRKKQVQFLQNGQKIEKELIGWPVYTIVQGRLFSRH